MKNKTNYALAVALLMTALSGCATLSTELSIPDKELPARFQDQKGAASIAYIN